MKLILVSRLGQHLTGRRGLERDLVCPPYTDDFKFKVLFCFFVVVVVVVLFVCLFFSFCQRIQHMITILSREKRRFFQRLTQV